MLLFIVTRVCSKRKGVSNEASGMRRKSVSEPNRPPDLATELTVNFIQLISYCTLYKRQNFHVHANLEEEADEKIFLVFDGR